MTKIRMIAMESSKTKEITDVELEAMLQEFDSTSKKLEKSRRILFLADALLLCLLSVQLYLTQFNLSLYKHGVYFMVLSAAAVFIISRSLLVFASKGDLKLKNLLEHTRPCKGTETSKKEKLYASSANIQKLDELITTQTTYFSLFLGNALFFFSFLISSFYFVPWFEIYFSATINREPQQQMQSVGNSVENEHFEQVNLRCYIASMLWTCSMFYILSENNPPIALPQ